MMTDLTQNIGLIGFMGTGKTSIGSTLAKSLHRQFYDTDLIIETKTGKTIQQIFEEEGEAAFRKLESKVVNEVCRKESCVISFGGGVVLSRSNIITMRECGIVVLLRSSVDTILKRTKMTVQRPLLNNIDEDIVTRIKTLLAVREELYESAMDFAVNTDALSVDEAVKTIIGRIGL